MSCNPLTPTPTLPSIAYLTTSFLDPSLPPPAAGFLERSGGSQVALLLVTMVSACMVISDGVLTPAISVISAIEGIEYNAGISKGARELARSLPPFSSNFLKLLSSNVNESK